MKNAVAGLPSPSRCRAPNGPLRRDGDLGARAGAAGGRSGVEEKGVMEQSGYFLL